MKSLQQDPFVLEDIFKGEKLYSLALSIFLLSGAYILEHLANLYELEYSLRPTSNHVGDIVLDNLPVVDLNLIVIQGALFAIVFGVLFVIFLRPRYILFTLKAIALFIAIRAFFISLTHVGIYPGHVYPGPGVFSAIYTYLNFQTGFFFSGHTGMPFLMALIFWREFRVRTAFLTMSFVFAVGVLFAHSHYSIDVFAAPFMAYGIFEIARYLFPRDYTLLSQAEKGA
ncbi:MAG: phosphatase PAP2-related protein [bacterium]|nr:phosphatase PAP2-related protein [bacterium]